MRRIVTAGAAALAVCGISGVVPGVVQASSVSAATWTQQHPATSPPVREQASMAYDAAAGTVVLIGAVPGHGLHYETWTWDGRTWTQQAATTPHSNDPPMMAYDAATGTVVLFRGANCERFTQTWTWDGTTWTQQADAHNPPGRSYLNMMAYDAATGTVVLLGGEASCEPHGYTVLADTWTWNGTRWTQQHPAASPPGRENASMAYDAATGTQVLFGGFDGSPLGDTWTWG